LKYSKLYIIAVIVLGYIFSACSSSAIQTAQNDSQAVKSKANLTQTYWKLITVQSKKVTFSKGNPREAYIILKANGNLKAHSGCNSTNGTYISSADKLSTNGAMMMTRMFCQGSLESEFISALKKMYRYKIDGEFLEIFDKDGNSLARFKSVYM
jgi:heat shock protein HslJ